MRFLPLAALAGAALLLQTTTALAQGTMPEDKSKRPSPPAEVKTTVGSTDLTIDYSRPSLKGREAFGAKSPLAPTGEVWRTGANEATTFTVNKPVKVNGQALAAGSYALFTIPGPTEWTVIFNKTAKQWGAFKYQEKDDALRLKVKLKTVAAPVEEFTITADKSGKVAMMWGKTQADFVVK
ncbi:DUF2911 domain-containing protein [Hymenobacter psoromatis]|uniref:DUF2911 domain-containing protein n=1 Tax=Hymenobacter psoromatis TaxID=1484116 RepID=UPI001CBBACF1|nr:DUF2911 domain-containing protein [Hymenobacter psoromatis]